jgi:hypothetical protein
MEIGRCPLCYIRPNCSVLDHLQQDHRRNDDEARALLARAREETLGWDPEAKKKRLSFRRGPARKTFGRPRRIGFSGAGRIGGVIQLRQESLAVQGRPALLLMFRRSGS